MFKKSWCDQWSLHSLLLDSLDFLQHVFVDEENHSSHFLEIHPGDMYDSTPSVGFGELSLLCHPVL